MNKETTGTILSIVFVVLFAIIVWALTRNMETQSYVTKQTQNLLATPIVVNMVCNNNNPNGSSPYYNITSVTSNGQNINFSSGIPGYAFTYNGVTYDPPYGFPLFPPANGCVSGTYNGIYYNNNGSTGELMNAKYNVTVK